MNEILSKLEGRLPPRVSPLLMLDRVKIEMPLVQEYVDTNIPSNQLCCAMLAPTIENLVLLVSDVSGVSNGLCFQFTAALDKYMTTTETDASFELLGMIGVELHNNGAGLRPIYSPYYSVAVLDIMHSQGIDVSMGELAKAVPSISRQNDYLAEALDVYAAAQMILADFPEALKNARKEFSKPPQKTVSKHGNNKRRQQKVKPYRVIELAALSANKQESGYNGERDRNVFKCLLWTVRGHYRHLGNGKVIWIKGYRKGTMRDKADAELSPKEYTTQEKR